MYNVNIDKFTDVIKKATLFFTINNVYFDITKDKIKSKMISSSKDFAIIINIDNDIIDNLPEKDEITFSFYEPQENLLPFLKIIENDEVPIKIKDNKIIIHNDKQKMDIFFCDESVVNKFNVNLPKIEPLISINLNDDMINDLFKIKKFSKFEKIYFTIKDNKLYVEIGDKINKFSNNLSIELIDVEYEDFVLCFNSNNILKLFNIFDLNKQWVLKLYGIGDNTGMIEFKTDDEQYYFMSKVDI